jgi:hypothetical protein
MKTIQEKISDLKNSIIKKINTSLLVNEIKFSKPIVLFSSNRDNKYEKIVSLNKKTGRCELDGNIHMRGFLSGLEMEMSYMNIEALAAILEQIEKKKFKEIKETKD